MRRPLRSHQCRHPGRPQNQRRPAASRPDHRAQGGPARSHPTASADGGPAPRVSWAATKTTTTKTSAARVAAAAGAESAANVIVRQSVRPRLVAAGAGRGKPAPRARASAAPCTRALQPPTPPPSSGRSRLAHATLVAPRDCARRGLAYRRVAACPARGRGGGERR